MDITEALQILAAGGDLGILVVLAVLWKIDRRLVKVETIIEKEVGHHGDI